MIRQFTRRQPGNRLVAGVIGAVAALTVLSVAGCASGPNAQTSHAVAAVNGASGETMTADAGPLMIRNATLAYPPDGNHYYPAGSDIQLQLTLINDGSVADELVGVTSGQAGSVELIGQTTVPSRQSVTVSPSRGDNGTTTQATTEAATGETTGPNSGLQIVLREITGDIGAGTMTQVTFQFREAGELTLHLPMDTPDEHRRVNSDEGGSGGSGGGH